MDAGCRPSPVRLCLYNRSGKGVAPAHSVISAGQLRKRVPNDQHDRLLHGSPQLRSRAPLKLILPTAPRVSVSGWVVMFAFECGCIKRGQVGCEFIKIVDYGEGEHNIDAVEAGGAD